MQMDIEKFLKEAGVEDPFYPGKRLVHACKQLGEYKNHSVVFDWRNPDKIRIEVKAGLSGKTLEDELLKKYPVSFQSPTYVDVEIVDERAADEDEEEGRASSGKGGSGGKQPKKKMESIAHAFGEMVESKIPNAGEVVDMMIMGMKVAEEAYASVLGVLAEQIQHARIAATDLLARASDLVTKYEPPAFLQPKGDETAKYEYDREKNADIGFRMTMA